MESIGTQTQDDGPAVRTVRGRAPRDRRRAAALLAGGAVLLVGGIWWLTRPPSVSTDDAFIDAHVVPVSSRVAGHVASVAAEDNREVAAGDVLVVIDPRDFQTALDSARAKEDSAAAEATRADADYARAKALFARDEVSRQQLDHAQAASLAAKGSLEQARAARRQAELDLSYTTVTAPEAGRVTRKSVEAGSYVSVGQPMLALVPKTVWVTANFKETQLTRVRPGQKAEIRVDAYPGKVLTGRVDSIQAGTGARFSLLPPENATGNFVKVVQRVPVKITLDAGSDADGRLSPGLSVEATVFLR
jgi:membrane fusion protein (multidrug efflux system)